MSTYDQRRRKVLKNRIIELKEGKRCVHCGESRSTCLDFHHLDETQKLFSITKARSLGKSWQAVLDEIDKCVLLCANCHRLVHAGELIIG